MPQARRKAGIQPSVCNFTFDEIQQKAAQQRKTQEARAKRQTNAAGKKSRGG